jgi:hypothetical protein
LLLLAFLNWVSRHSDVNKMDVDNLARVMAPNMLYDGKTTTNFYGEMHVVSLMIKNYERLSMVGLIYTFYVCTSSKTCNMYRYQINLMIPTKFP